MKVTVTRTPSGFLPVTSWGSGENADRQPYAMAYDDLARAERAGRDWAAEQGAEYVPYAPVDGEAVHRQALLVKRLREEEGLDLRAAIAKARSILADDEASTGA